MQTVTNFKSSRHSRRFAQCASRTSIN